MYENMGKLIRETRKERGLKQWEISDALGLTCEQFISNIERGLCTVPPKRMKKVSELLKIDSSTLVDAWLADKRELLSKM